MTADIDHLVEDVRKLVAELETVMANSKDGAGERVGDGLEGAAAGLLSALNAAQRRIDDVRAKLERRIGQTAKTVKETVRENPWGAVAIGAGVALLLGLVLSRGATASERACTSERCERGG